MSEIEASLQAIRDALHGSRKRKATASPSAEHSQAFDNVCSHLVLLDSTPLSPQASQKLVQCLRDPLVPIYHLCPGSALGLASSIFQKIYCERVMTALRKQTYVEKILWENALCSLLSGIIDFLETHENNAVKDAIGAALYPALCEALFSPTALMVTVDVRSTAYTLLCDAAASHQLNQTKLRDPAMLGGQRLGHMIWSTKDYLALESLLDIFARILPSKAKSLDAKTKRAQFIKSVFVTAAPSDFKNTGTIISDLLEQVSTRNWDESAFKIIHILAQSSMAFPQPFSVNNVLIGRRMNLSEKLFVDDKGFTVNILLEDGLYESLNVLYSTIKKINTTVVTKDRISSIRVKASVPSSPILGRYALKSESQDDTLVLEFDITGAEIDRFMEAIRARGLNADSKGKTPLKLSLANLPARLEFDGSDDTPCIVIGGNSQEVQRTDSDQPVIIVERSSTCNDRIEKAPSQSSSELHKPTPKANQDAIRRSGLAALDNISVLGARASISHSPKGISESSNDSLSEISGFDTSIPGLLDASNSKQTRLQRALSKGRKVIDPHREIESSPSRSSRELSAHNKAPGKATPILLQDLTPDVSNEVPNNKPSLGSSLTDNPNRISSPHFHSSARKTAFDELNDSLEDDSRSAGLLSSPSQKAMRTKTTVVAKMRNANQPSVKTDNTRVHIEAKKRPREINEVHTEDSYRDQHLRPKKRSRTGSHVLKSEVIATTRPVRRYRAKKGGKSSPRKSSSAINYDVLPTGTLSKQAMRQDLPVTVSPDPKTASDTRRKTRATAFGIKDTNGRNSTKPVLKMDPVPQAMEPHPVAKHTDTIITERDGDRSALSEHQASPADIESITKRAVGFKSRSRKSDDVEVASDHHEIVDSGIDLGHDIYDDKSQAIKPTVDSSQTSSGLSKPVHLDQPHVTNQLSGSSIEKGGDDNNKHMQIKENWIDSASIKPSRVRPVASNVGVQQPQDSQWFHRREVEEDKKDESLRQEKQKIVNRASSGDYTRLSLYTDTARSIEDLRISSPLKKSSIHAVPKGPAPHAVDPHATVAFGGVSARSFPRLLEPYKLPAQNEAVCPVMRKNESESIQSKAKAVKYTANAGNDIDMPRNATDCGDEGNMQKLLGVLNKIHQVVLERISNGFEGIREDVRSGRDALLAEAASNLHHMRADRVTHFNALIDLESQYAKCARSITSSYEDMVDSNDNICVDFVKILQLHDNSTVIQKIPSSVVASIPLCISKLC